MKCYVLMVSTLFPQNHPKAGKKTFFPQYIKQRLKLHTIRAGTNWAKRVEEVNTGSAYISVRVWSGKPYGSPQVEILSLKKGECGAEPIQESPNMPSIEVLASNDGLSVEEFCEWFKIPKDANLGKALAGHTIIHFTDLNYGLGEPY